jgi:hypothetical protein
MSKVKVTQIVEVQHGAVFKPAEHTKQKLWDSEDTSILICLLLTFGAMGYFGYGLLN